jgi:formylglycine-generating enzyme required for sulfatase activity
MPTWTDCEGLIRRLNRKEGTENYRFPFESEWECACRAGSNDRFCLGDDDLWLEEFAWYYDNSGLRTHPVGYKKPNAFGCLAFQKYSDHPANIY